MSEHAHQDCWAQLPEPLGTRVQRVLGNNSRESESTLRGQSSTLARKATAPTPAKGKRKTTCPEQRLVTSSDNPIAAHAEEDRRNGSPENL